MKKNSSRAVIISVSSDIGHALAQRWLKESVEIVGTYRTMSPAVEELKNLGVKTVRCDLADSASIRRAGRQLSLAGPWDHLVLCAGTLVPVGSFMDCNFDQWAEAVEINFIRQLQLVHALLPSRNTRGKKAPVVMFFAGSGTNSAAVNYSAYTVSKIALIKMCELLDAEISDTKFVIVGPGWVKTKIHQETVEAGIRAGANYRKTLDKLAGEECTPMDKVLDCCDWLVRARRQAVGGRNFSVVFDQWGQRPLVDLLVKDRDMYKLRRHGNAVK